MHPRIAIFAALIVAHGLAQAHGPIEPLPPSPAPSPAPISGPQSASAATGGTSTSGALAGAISGAISGPSSASTGPVTSGSTSGGGSSWADAQGGSVGAVTTGPASASSSQGPINVAPASSMQSTSRAYAIGLPAPVSASASAANCLVAGNGAWAIGWNAVSRATPQAWSDPVCTLRAMAAEADAACQYRTGALIRQRIAARVDPELALPVADHVVDLDPAKCLEARQPRILQAAAPSVTVEATAVQGQEVAPATITPAPAVQPKRRPVAPKPVQPCPTGQVLQCVPVGGAR